MPLSDYLTLAAILVALFATMKDSYHRICESRSKANCFQAYFRPAAELLIRRASCVLGALEKQKKIRLGAPRPYDTFRMTSLLMHKEIWLKSENALEQLWFLPEKKALALATALGEMPMLLSDLETLAATNREVFINEKDQDLINSSTSRLKKIKENLQITLNLTSEGLDKPIENYQETIFDGDEKLIVQGYND
ncbi:hypothetical protein QP835_04070 [Pseudomonas oryzihabitans]|uniref:hypothetical protein n=1 Tax=Pseudomonas oryzihabitans TaxID=47885 RepID=UPI0025566E74|nr:hypothetical protein [Pseudomonas oryzihabitans]MDK8263449.1 hypothetical protein [Pseudomonas oryzihabitans]